MERPGFAVTIRVLGATAELGGRTGPAQIVLGAAGPFVVLPFMPRMCKPPGALLDRGIIPG